MDEMNKPRHPGQVLLEDFLTPLGLSQAGLADHLGWTYARLNEIVNARRGLTADSACSFSEAFGTTAEFWMDLQRDWELWKVKQNRQPVAPLQVSPEGEYAKR